MSQPKIKVKLSEKKQKDWNAFLEMLINEAPFGDFTISSDRTKVTCYPQNDPCWSFEFNNNGTWSLE